MSGKDAPKDWASIDGSDDVPLEESDGEEPQPEEEGDDAEEGQEDEDAEEGQDEDAEEELDEEAENQHEEESGPVEVIEVQPEKTRRAKKNAGRGRSSKGRPVKEEHWSKKKLYAVVAVLLIILVPVIGFAYFFYGPSGDVKRIDLITRPYTKDDDSGMIIDSGIVIAAQIDTGKPSSLSGAADIVISFNGSTVYTGKMDVQDSRSNRELSLGDFAVEDGNYTVDFTFQGFTQKSVFPVDGIIEMMNATAWAINSTINSTLAPPGTARLGVRVIMTTATGLSQMASSKDKLTIEIGRGGTPERYTESLSGKARFEKTYPIPGNGNYTVNVTFLNSKVKPGSKYSQMTFQAIDSNNQTHAFVYVAIPPVANAGPDQTVAWKVQDQGAVVTLDGSRSTAYEGTTIVEYWWNYNDGTAEDGVKVTHKYTQKNDVETPFYVVTLTVKDSNGQISSDEVHIIVT
jgi:hypothetical protein